MVPILGYGKCGKYIETSYERKVHFYKSSDLNPQSPTAWLSTLIAKPQIVYEIISKVSATLPVGYAQWL